MNKIVTTNDVSFPFKWVQINSFEDISGLPMSETNNLGRNTITVPCVCMFNRWNLKRNTPLPLDESLTFYEIPVPVQDSSGFVDASMRMAMFVFNFDHNEWIGMNGSVSLPNWAVYYALPICSFNSPDMNNHMDIKEPKERLLRFPNTQRNDVVELTGIVGDTATLKLYPVADLGYTNDILVWLRSADDDSSTGWNPINDAVTISQEYVNINTTPTLFQVLRKAVIRLW